MLRIGVAVEPGGQQPFSVRCPRCDSAIRGRLITTENADVSAQLDEAALLTQDASDDWQIITTHPAFPFMPDTDQSPFISLGDVLGNAAMPYFEAVGQFNGLASGDWTQLERAFQFYLAEDWERLDRSMSVLMSDSWPESPNMVARHDLIHRLPTVMILPLDPGGGLYGDAQPEIWKRAEPSEALVQYVRDPANQMEFLSLQKRLFRQISHMIHLREMWMPSLPYLWLNRLGVTAPDGWRLPGDDFAILRGTYQQNFELSCQALPTLIAVQNSAEGRPATRICLPDEPSPWVPDALSNKENSPRTLAQFKKMTAERKIAFLDRFPATEAMWWDAFDRQLRNAIAHADTDEVVSTGNIVTGKGVAFSYLSFVESVAKQLALLLLWLNLAKLLRVYYVLDMKQET